MGEPDKFQRTPFSSDTSKVKIDFVDGIIPPTFSGKISVTNIAVEASTAFPAISSLETPLLGTNTNRTLKLHAGNSYSNPTIAEFDLSIYNTLPKLKDAINSVKGLSATIIQSGSTANPYYVLSIKNGTGTENTFLPEITTSDISGVSAGGLLSSGAITTQGQDASISVDGVNITSSSNIFTDVLPGLQITAVAPTGLSPIDISSKTNGDALTNAMSTLVVGFNELVKSIKTESNYNEDPTLRGSLANNSSTRQLLNELARFTTQPISGYDNQTYSMTDLGVTTNRDGTISFDQKKFAQILQEKPEKVEAILSSKKQLSDSRIKFGSSGARTQSGIYSIQKNSIDNWTVNGQVATYKNGMLTYKDQTNTIDISLIIPNSMNISAPNGYSTKLFFAKGMVERFSDMLTSVTDANSPINTISKAASSEITKLQEDQKKLDARMTQLNDRYVKQFAAMQTFVNQANDTKKSITSMMDAWSNSMKG